MIKRIFSSRTGCTRRMRRWMLMKTKEIRNDKTTVAILNSACPIGIYNKRTYPRIEVPRVLLYTILLFAASWWPMLTTAVLSYIYRYSNQAYPMPKKNLKFIPTLIFQLYRIEWCCSVSLCLIYLHADLERMERYNETDIWLCNFWNHAYKFSLLLV